MTRLFRPAGAPLWIDPILQSIERALRKSFGFERGDGGTVTQITSKATAVTLDASTGTITLNNAALAAATIVSFTLNNARVEADDQIIATHHSGGTVGAYSLNGRATGAGTAQITLRNNTAGSLSEAVVVKFSVVKSYTQ